MIYLIILAIIVAFLGILHPKHGFQKNNYKAYMIICGILVAVVAAMRDPYTGSGDTYQYVTRYAVLQNYDSFQEYYNAKLSGYHFLLSEAGFYYIMWVLGRIVPSEQMAIIFSSAMVTALTCRFIRRNSVDPSLSMTIYVCLGLFTFNMNGMRQAMAMSVCLVAYDFAKNKKLIPFILTVLLAMQFHRTAMCFLPVFFLPYLKNNLLSWCFYVAGLLCCLVFVDQIIAGYFQIGGKDYTGSEAATGGGVFVVLLYLGTIVLTMYNHQIIKRKTVHIALLATLAGFTAYVSRFLGIALLERVSYYYFYFPVLLIPETIRELDEEEYSVVKIIFVLGSVLLFAYRIWKGNFHDFTFFFLERTLG